MCVHQQVKEKTCLASPTLSVLQTSDRFEQAASVTNDATGQTRKSNYPVTTCGGRQLLGDVINSSLTVRVHRSRTMFWKTETGEANRPWWKTASDVLKSNISKSFFLNKKHLQFQRYCIIFSTSLSNASLAQHENKGQVKFWSVYRSGGWRRARCPHWWSWLSPSAWKTLEGFLTAERWWPSPPGNTK